MKAIKLLSAALLAVSALAVPIRRAPSATRYAGVNIAGFDFGCDTDGHCVTSSVTPAADYAAQMQHFVTDDKLNLFRLPVGWQYLVDSQCGGTLAAQNFATYDREVKACLATGAHCVIDVHNYGRWDGGVVGQGGPSDAQFANLWSQLAKKYASNGNVVFGLMNEPHDLPDVKRWATTLQTAVTAIRNAGAKTQMILLPGNNWTSAGSFVSTGSLSALQAVKDYDGSTTNLVFEVHQYLDQDYSGKSTECVGDGVDSAFAPLAKALRQAGRKAMLMETGGGNSASCEQYVCSMLRYLK